MKRELLFAFRILFALVLILATGGAPVAAQSRSDRALRSEGEVAETFITPRYFEDSGVTPLAINHRGFVNWGDYDNNNDPDITSLGWSSQLL